MTKSSAEPSNRTLQSMQQEHREQIETIDWFVSYNKADLQWAEWITWHLEKAGYHVLFQAWDFRPGSNFVLEMQRAASLAVRTIAVLSPDYLNAQFPQPEWAAAFAQDATGSLGKLLPVRVRECKLEGLLSSIIYIDLVDKDEQSAKDALLRGISRDRAKPSAPPSFPGSATHTVGRPVAFPGVPAALATQSTSEHRSPAFSSLFELAGPPVREIAQSEFYKSLNEKRAFILQIGSSNSSAFPMDLRKHFKDSYNDRVLLGYLSRKQIMHFDIFRKKHLDSYVNIEHKGRDGYYLFVDGHLVDFHSGYLDEETSKKISDEIAKIDQQTKRLLLMGTAVAALVSDDPVETFARVGSGISAGLKGLRLKSIIDRFESQLIKAGIR